MDLRGTMLLHHDGRDYPLTIDMGALCTFEDVTGKNGFAMLALLENGGIRKGLIGARDMRALIYGGLKGDAPEMTLELAGRILDANASAFVAGVNAAMPQEGDGPAPEKRPGNRRRPRKRRATSI